MERKILFFVALCLGLQQVAAAQGLGLLDAPTNPEYIENYADQLTLRTFISRKIIGYQVGKQGSQHEAEYSPNDRTSFGVGFSYKALGLNVNFNIPGLNDDDDVYGKTKSLDLASYLYLRKFTVDAFIQSYKGHYLSDNDILNSRIVDGPYVVRPDLRTQFYGINAQYIFNHTKFSYRAAFLQNEWQKKSAGSFLAGVNIHHMRINADSAVIPKQAASEFNGPAALFSSSNVTSLGVNGGYAHTFVLKRHLFATIALMAGVGGNHTALTNEDTDLDITGGGLHLNGTLRLAAGYNSEHWFVGGAYTNFLNRNFAPSEADGLWQQGNTGVYRLTVARRLAFRQGKGM